MKKILLLVAFMLVGFLGVGQNNNSYIIKFKTQNDSVCFNTQNVSGIRIDAFGQELIHDNGTEWTALEELDTVYVYRTENAPDWIDLGLPSGLLWATHNVGANAPEEYGDYFAWAETSPKSVYDWETYLYSCNHNYWSFTKYCYEFTSGCNGYTDTLTILQPGDDAATMNWGGGARTPTVEEWRELRDHCTWVWTTLNGVNGSLFTGPNGNTLFLPACCRYNEEGLYGWEGQEGWYWSSSLYQELFEVDIAYDFYIGYIPDFGNGWADSDRAVRNHGLCVRAVRSAK